MDSCSTLSSNVFVKSRNDRLWAGMTDPIHARPDHFRSTYVEYETSSKACQGDFSF